MCFHRKGQSSGELPYLSLATSPHGINSLRKYTLEPGKCFRRLLNVVEGRERLFNVTEDFRGFSKSRYSSKTVQK